jgi:hypothetical protein
MRSSRSASTALVRMSAVSSAVGGDYGRSYS